MSSPSSSVPVPKYPYPYDVNVEDYVPLKLSSSNYYLWKSRMRDLIENQGLVGFINGNITAPPEKIIPVASVGGAVEVDNQDYLDWKKTDELLRRWLFKTLDENVLVHVHRLKTAKEVWKMLGKVYAQISFNPRNIVVTQVQGNNLSQYLPLHKAVLKGDWERVNNFIQAKPEAANVAITGFSETALIIAVRSGQRTLLVERLVELMSSEDLAKRDNDGATALHISAVVGNIEAAKFLVEKNGGLPYIADQYEELPIHRAAMYGQREMVWYLLTVTKEDGDPKPFEDTRGAKIVCDLIDGGLYDIALFLLQRHPTLASGDPSPLESIARKPSAFRSGTRHNFLQRLIYSFVPMQLESYANQRSKADIENLTNNVVSVNQWHAIFWQVTEKLVPQINQIREKKLKHHQALGLVKHICNETIKLDYGKASSLLEEPLKMATQAGIHEVVEEIMDSFPSIVYFKSEKNQTPIQLAIVHRREKVFNLIYQFQCRHIFLSPPDISNNSGLHLAGCLEPEQKLNLRAAAAGAALQMQRELQWFKEVEKFTAPQSKEMINPEQKTPSMVFTEKHDDLVKDGEQWMKDTANASTIVAALIATIVFAAAITVPGGSNGDSGLPIFYGNGAFTVFAISDALALFASTSSLLMFLSILTSRYGEEDFLYVLPTRLIIGLITLFVSIISMMVAFGATVHLVFAQDKRWVLIPTVALSCLPVTLFAFLQFPLLLDMIISTYTPGIFGKQSDRILF